ncbi:MAG: DUF1178 family protein [Burkholderiaceae bacterium]
MKVLNLQCSGGHVFEGWFASEDDFQDQQARQLVACPLCSDTAVSKMLSAPRLNLGRGGPPPVASDSARSAAPGPGDQAAPVASLPPQAMQAAWLQMVRRVLAQTEDVGERFADEARRIHHGEAAERGIRGQATPEQTEALLEEGIAVMPLPIPDSLKTTLQ